MAYCSNCGNQLIDTAKFCPNCGEETSIIDQSKASSISQKEMSKIPTSEKINVINSNSNYENVIRKYVESGKVNLFPLILISISATFLSILLAYCFEYVFYILNKINLFIGAPSNLWFIQSGIEIIVKIIIPFSIVIIGLFVIFYLILTIGKVRNKIVLITLSSIISIVCWIYSNYYADLQLSNILLGNNNFVDLLVVPDRLSESWINIGSMVKLICFVGIGIVFAYTFDYFYCEKCNKEFASEFFYVLNSCTDEEYLNERINDRFKDIEKFNQTEVISKGKNFNIIKNELHTCNNCGDKILIAKKCEITADAKGKLSLKETQKIIENRFI